MISHRQIFDLAWPYTLSMATTFIIQAVDSTMVAPLGSSALAALAVAASAAFIPNAVTMGLITSVQKRCALTKDPNAIREVLAGGFLISLLIALPFTAIYFTFADSIARFYTSSETARLASQYLKILSFSFVFASFNQTLNGYWIGSLKSKTRLVITLAAMTLAVCGNLLLTPKFGLPGVAFAAVAAIVGSFLLNLYLTCRTVGLRWKLPPLRTVGEDTKTVIGICAHQVLLALTLNAAIVVVGLIGIDALAVANVISVLALPALYLGIGYGTATGTFLAQSIQTRDLAATKEICRRALMQIFFVSLGLGVLILIFATPLRHWYFKDPATFELSKTPIYMLAALYIIDGFCTALQRFHFISDSTHTSMLIMGAVQWGVFLPIAWIGTKFLAMGYVTYLSFHLMQRGVIAIALYATWIRRIHRLIRTDRDSVTVGLTAAVKKADCTEPPSSRRTTAMKQLSLRP
jgi:Na+-driven multidrug efflux pump